MRGFLILALLMTTFMPNQSKNPSTLTATPTAAQSEELRSLKSEKTSLQNQTNVLKGKQDFWDRANLKLSIFLVIGASILGGLVWFSQHFSSKYALAQRPIGTRIEEIDNRTGAINADANRAALADTQGNVLILQKDAFDAKTAQQRTEIDLEKQKERTAKAEAELVEVKNRQADRFIPKNALASLLRGKATGSIKVMYQPDNNEAFMFASSLAAELSAAGWRVFPIPEPIPPNMTPRGPGESGADAQRVSEFMQRFPIAMRAGVGAKR